MKHKFTIEYEGINGKREFANTDELLVNGDNIEHMIIVPKGATNGDMIKAMFPSSEVREIMDDLVHYTLDGYVGAYIPKDWWNAPYKI